MNDRINGIPSGSGNVFHKGSFSFGKSVQECRFPDIGSAHQGKTDFVFLFFSMVSCDIRQDLVQKVTDISSMCRADADHIFETERVEIEHPVFVRCIINLVPDDDYRFSGFSQLKGDFFVLCRDTGDCIHDKEQDIAFRYGNLNLTVNGPMYPLGPGIRHPSGIDKVKRLALPFGQGIKPVPCNSGLVVNYCFPSSGYAVEKGRFSDIRPSHDCYNRHVSHLPQI